MSEQTYTDEIINKVIGKIIDSFYRVSMSYDPYGKTDSRDFYLNGNCNSFAIIMYEIFGDCVKFYHRNKNNTTHTIVKIYDNYYDIRGCINDKIDINEYIEYSLNEILYQIEIHNVFSHNMDHENEIEADLIAIGKKKLQELLEEKNIAIQKR